jgi:CheY-like chemotaxis protein
LIEHDLPRKRVAFVARENRYTLFRLERSLNAPPRALEPDRSNVHFCTFMRNEPASAAFGAWNFAEGEKVANLPIVLIVEDDEAIQSIVEDTLKEGGFEIAIAASAEEAVTLLKGKVMNYRALVTDISLKGRMNGWEVAKQAREIDPTFPIVYMTGAAANDWASHGVPNSLLLEKPFAPAQLVTAVSQLLNVPPSSQS